jgi:hypothetical protein
MKIQMQKRSLVWILAAVILCASMLSQLTQSTSTDTDGSYVTEASYVIFGDGPFYCAKNGLNGSISYNSTDAATVIRAVVQEIMANGGEIFIKKGEYPIARQLVEAGWYGQKITIKGEGSGTILKLADGVNVYPMFYFYNLGDVTLEDFVIDGDKTYNTGDPVYGMIMTHNNRKNFRFENLEIRNCATGGIRFTLSTVGFISHCYIHDNDGSGVLVSTSSDIHISQNSIVDNTMANPIGLYGGVAISNSQKVYVDGNTIKRATFGIDIGGAESRQIYITSNDVYGNEPEDPDIICQDGIEVYSKGIREVFIIGNRVEGFHRVGTSGYAIEIGQGYTPDYAVERCYVISNEIRNCWDGIVVNGKRNYVAQNTINITRGFAIYEEGRYDASDFNVFLGNVIINGTVRRASDAGSSGLNSVFRGNVGYTTENSGIAVLPAGATSVSFAHGLVGTPRVVVYSWKGMIGGSYSLELYVDSFDNNKTGWEPLGLAPYLDAIDSSYVRTNTNGAETGCYWFADSGKSDETIDSVKLAVYCRYESSGDEEIKTYIYDGTSWVQGPNTKPLGTSLTWIEVDVSSILDTWAKIDSAGFYMVYLKVGSKAVFSDVDACRLIINYSTGLPPPPTQSSWSANSTHITITTSGSSSVDHELSWYAEYRP